MRTSAPYTKRAPAKNPAATGAKAYCPETGKPFIMVLLFVVCVLKFRIMPKSVVAFKVLSWPTYLLIHTMRIFLPFQLQVQVETNMRQLALHRQQNQD